MKKLFYVLPTALILLIACNNHAEKEADHQDQESTEMNKKSTEDNHEHEEVQNKVLLDSGKKWKANPETITGIDNMLTLVQAGIDNKKEIATLYEPLQFEFKTIFEKCTMTGESHNQLHNYLLPLKDDLEKFKKGNITAERLKEMQEYLQTFKNYFE